MLREREHLNKPRLQNRHVRLALSRSCGRRRRFRRRRRLRLKDLAGRVGWQQVGDRVLRLFRTSRRRFRTEVRNDRFGFRWREFKVPLKNLRFRLLPARLRFPASDTEVETLSFQCLRRRFWPQGRDFIFSNSEPQVFCFARQQLDDFFERLAAMLEITELVKACAGRGQEDNITWLSALERVACRSFEVSRIDEFGSSCKLFGNPLSRSANQEDVLYPALDHSPERLVRCTLVLTSQDQVDPALEGRERIDGCVHACGLGIVVELHADDFTHEFQPMLNAAKFSHRLANRIEPRSQDACRGRRCQDILQVEVAAQAHVLPAQDHTL